jgi:hypothetical protein
MLKALLEEQPPEDWSPPEDEDGSPEGGSPPEEERPAEDVER